MQIVTTREAADDGGGWTAQRSYAAMTAGGGSTHSQQIRVAGLKRPVRVSKMFKVQLTSEDASRAISGDEFKRIAMGCIIIAMRKSRV